MQNQRELLDRSNKAIGKEKIPDLLEPVNGVLYKIYSGFLYTRQPAFVLFNYGRVEHFNEWLMRQWCPAFISTRKTRRWGRIRSIRS